MTDPSCRNRVRRARERGVPSEGLPIDPVAKPGHPCAIPGCTRPAKLRQLMCWPHWRRVPKALNRAIFDTFANGPAADYLANVTEAVRVIQEKESSE